jgi:hypothetical protein
MLTRERRPDAAVVGIGAAVVAVGCCAGMPAIAALLGGLTLGAILGLGLGAVILGTLAWAAVAVRGRRRDHARCQGRSHR